jgi:hypothetical protein
VLTRRLLLAGVALASCTTAQRRPAVQDFSHELQAALPVQPPFGAVFGRGTIRLGVVAARHTSDPADPTFAAISAVFARVAPKVLIVEGVETRRGVNPSAIVGRLPAPDAPFGGGERGFAARAAATAGADVLGGEPSDAEVFERLRAGGFDAREAFYASLFGPLDQDMRTGRVTGPRDARFDAAFERWSRDIGGGLAPELDLSASAFRAWYRERFGMDLNDDPDWLRSNDPAAPGPLQSAVKAHMRARDEHLLDLIVEQAALHERIAVVYGGSHVATLWAPLAARFGRPILL